MHRALHFSFSVYLQELEIASSRRPTPLLSLLALPPYPETTLFAAQLQHPFFTDNLYTSIATQITAILVFFSSFFTFFICFSSLPEPYRPISQPLPFFLFLLPFHYVDLASLVSYFFSSTFQWHFVNGYLVLIFLVSYLGALVERTENK